MNILFKDESYQIIGACFEVYNEKGNGFLEAVYQECLGLELDAREVPFREKPRLRLEYKGRPLRQEYEPDFLCFGEILLEIKAVKTLLPEHRAQAVNYLKSTGKPLALLVNFGSFPKLQHERFLHPNMPRENKRPPST